MRDFTREIKPCIDEIAANYTPVTDEVVLRDCNVELILNKRGSNECVSIGKNKAFTMFNKSIHNLYSAIWDFAECCETYEGELDGWAFREEQRVQEAIRTGIIAYYKGGIDDGH